MNSPRRLPHHPSSIKQKPLSVTSRENSKRVWNNYVVVVPSIYRRGLGFRLVLGLRLVLVLMAARRFPAIVLGFSRLVALTPCVPSLSLSEETNEYKCRTLENKNALMRYGLLLAPIWRLASVCMSVSK